VFVFYRCAQSNPGDPFPFDVASAVAAGFHLRPRLPPSLPHQGWPGYGGQDGGQDGGTSRTYSNLKDLEPADFSQKLTPELLKDDNSLTKTT